VPFPTPEGPQTTRVFGAVILLLYCSLSPPGLHCPKKSLVMLLPLLLLDDDSDDDNDKDENSDDNDDVLPHRDSCRTLS